MTLIQGNEQYAIWDHINCGPIYGATGAGCDLAIYDKCNQNSDSYANFPYSYNCGSKYQNNQQSYTLFSGGYNFRVIEYEVFEVVK
jgi:hypothetical protein